MDLRRLTQVEAHEIRTRAKVHRRNLIKIKQSPASVDSRPPKTRMLPHIQRKRKKNAQERTLREKEIQRENVRIMERMTKILNEKHFKDAKAEQQRASTTQRIARAKVRRMTLNEIERENAHLKRRLQATQPVYSNDEWVADRKVKERYLNTLAVYKPPRPSKSLSAPGGPSPRACRASLQESAGSPLHAGEECKTTSMQRAPTQVTRPKSEAPLGKLSQTKRAESWRETALSRLRTIVLHRLPASHISPRGNGTSNAKRHPTGKKSSKGTAFVVKRTLRLRERTFFARLQWDVGSSDALVTLFDARTHESHAFKFAKRLLRRWLSDEHRRNPTHIMELCLVGLHRDQGTFEIHLPAPAPLTSPAAELGLDEGNP
ncbi:Hypothetical Protein FCC1311_004752 [Hondaea fermentalgiana]|uniref:Uncharacterized protein n=1 Tax=Hondaea fermentalgiana TaxID=2315210 RepID=A0A2R5FZR5_9STRA|nr:Hypothetical Protein FCC1311_004752 [Hondaea fermentalgiana]|eukprot:GBG24257.1 Hypothetical Protein FCC1311_004752 [Hondaea fermentalgiana]